MPGYRFKVGGTPTGQHTHKTTCRVCANNGSSEQNKKAGVRQKKEGHALGTAPRTTPEHKESANFGEIVAIACRSGSFRRSSLQLLVPGQGTMLTLHLTLASLTSGGSLTICTGARCWRNGAGRLLEAAAERGSARAVGCSGVCPQGAVSVCEGPDCPGDALVLPARDEAQAISSANLALARCRPPKACASNEGGASNGEEVDLTDDVSVKEAIVATLQLTCSEDERASRLRFLAEALEPLCEIDRLGTSPLVDGYWELFYADSPPAWWGRHGRVRHAIESAAPTQRPTGDDDVAPADSVSGTSPGAPGLRTGPRGGEWNDVSEGRGAYVQRCRRNLFLTTELRATYTWLGGEAWELTFVSRKQLLFGALPVWRSRSSTLQLSSDLDHALRPTFVDGDYLILRTPAVTAGGDVVLRSKRMYMLRRLRNRLWQDNDFVGMSDRWEARWEP